MHINHYSFHLTILYSSILLFIVTGYSRFLIVQLAMRSSFCSCIFLLARLPWSGVSVFFTVGTPFL